MKKIKKIVKNKRKKKIIIKKVRKRKRNGSIIKKKIKKVIPKY